MTVLVGATHPHNYADPDSYAHLDEIRQLIFLGKVEEAEKLSATVMGAPRLLMPYQRFCDAACDKMT